jgi:hypothetical protein
MINNIRKLIQEETEESKALFNIRNFVDDLEFINRVHQIDADLLHEKYVAKTEKCIFITGGN